MRLPLRYSYAGRRILSNWPLPELAPVGGRSHSGAPALQVRLARGHSSPRSSAPEPFERRDAGPSIPLRFPDLAEFLIARDALLVRVRPAPACAPAGLRHLLLDQVLPRVLAYHGRTVLHAGGVRVGGGVIALLGDSGRGKSTLTASFHAAGYGILSDDGLVLSRNRGAPGALATYPSLRLYPDAVAALYAEPPPATRMGGDSRKLRLRLAGPPGDGGGSLPLRALLLIAPPHEATRAVSLTPLSARDACVGIIENSFQLDLGDPRRTAAILRRASELSRQVPAFRLCYPRDFACLPRVLAAIRSRFEATARPSPVVGSLASARG